VKPESLLKTTVRTIERPQPDFETESN